MGELPTYGHRVPKELKDELGALHKNFTESTGEKSGQGFMRHLGDLYKRELNGDFDGLALREVATSTATELKDTSKQLNKLTENAHELLISLYRSKDIAGEFVNLQAQLRECEQMTESLRKQLLEKDVAMDALKQIHEDAILSLEKQHRINLEEKMLKQRRDFQEVMTKSTQRHQREIQEILEKMQGSFGWRLFGKKKKDA